MSAFIEVTPELMAGFLDEAPEYLAMLDDGLMAFEAQAGADGISLEDPEDQERMNTMFRAAHSLKGLAATMGFDNIRDLTHLMETLFDHVRMGKRVLDATAVEALFGVFDKLRALVTELSDPPDEPATIDAELETLEQIMDSPTDTGPAAEARPAGDTEPQRPETPKALGTSPASFSPSTSGSVEIPELKNDLTADPELLQRFVETTLETIEELVQQLLRLEKAPTDSGILNDVFRCAHNIKGASGAVGCNTMYRLTHDMETVLDGLRGEELALDDELFATLLQMVDRLQADIGLIKAGRPDELSSEGIIGVFTRWLPEVPTAPPAQTEPTTFEPDDGTVVVTVRFPKDSDEAAIQAFLIHNKLGTCGDVLGVTPDLDTIDPNARIEEVAFYLRTTADPEKLEALVSSYLISEVRVTRTKSGLQCSSGSEPAGPAASGVPTDLNRAQTPEPAPNPPGAPPTAAPEPAAGKPSSSLPTSIGTAPVKKQETIRVDLERLDQLMNLGGELVINKARLSQIVSKLATALAGRNLTTLVDDLSGRIHRLKDGLDQVRSGSNQRQLVADMSDDLLHLAHDFESVKGLISQVGDSRELLTDFSEAMHSLNRVSEGIQKRVMQTRMVAIGPLFQRFRRVVRDIAKSTQKKIELVLHGELTELDKRMIDELGDPLTHMVRNSVDHGIESPEERARAGKPETGRVELNAFHRGRHICIEVRDDGKGLDVEAIKRKILAQELATPAQIEQMSSKEAMQYVFRPAFSTAEQVSDLSGRGMGMDIVTSKIEAINGTVELDSVPGKGTTFTIHLPLTLASIPAL
ncbi:MAG: Hpt domain-containing protein, partial [Planctomycetes bacterium]|nr:Hpt domain-containing protein [Planctomycetota bacterium]